MLHWFAVRLAQTGKKVGKEEKGFTLIELLVVVIIIGILAAIAIPTFLAQREKAQAAAVESDLRNAGTAFTECITTTSKFSECNTSALLGDYGYNKSANVDAVSISGSADNATITTTHSDNTDVDGTYNSDTGQVSVNTDPPASSG